MRGILLLLLMLSVISLTVTQPPVSKLCLSLTSPCPPGHVCRVFQQCPICQPIPVCVPCGMIKGVDALCNRNGYSHTLLTVYTSLRPRTCPRKDCPFDSVCVVDETTRLKHCCYNQAPLGIPPVCI